MIANHQYPGKLFTKNLRNTPAGIDHRIKVFDVDHEGPPGASLPQGLERPLEVVGTVEQGCTGIESLIRGDAKGELRLTQ